MIPFGISKENEKKRESEPKTETQRAFKMIIVTFERGIMKAVSYINGFVWKCYHMFNRPNRINIQLKKS